MKCPGCGYELQDGSRECPKCLVIFSKFNEVKAKKDSGVYNIKTTPGDAQVKRKKPVGMILLIVVIIAAAAVYFISRNKKQAAVFSDTAPVEKILNISNGEKVNITDYLVKDKVTVFDFYAEWCGPCRALAPKLEAYAMQADYVVIRKINIVDWNSEVTKQYGIQFVPNVRVYDKKGIQVGEPVSDYAAILKNIEQAK